MGMTSTRAASDWYDLARRPAVRRCAVARVPTRSWALARPLGPRCRSGRTDTDLDTSRGGWSVRGALEAGTTMAVSPVPAAPAGRCFGRGLHDRELLINVKDQTLLKCLTLTS